MPRIRNIDDPDELRPANAEGLDCDGVVITAMQLSRLVRDNAYCRELRCVELLQQPLGWLAWSPPSWIELHRHIT
jgi:hypothetical protein